MFNYKSFAFLFLYSANLFAGKAIVIVLETAMLKERSSKSKVLQLVRKNEMIWIRNREFGHSRLRPDYSILNDNSKFETLRTNHYISGENKSGYIETMDRNGGTAYIKKSHIKLIYKDDREFLTNVNPFIQDPTDYRLEEPLPKNYPLIDPNKKRAFILAMFGPAHKSRYNYKGNVSSTSRSFRKGLAFGYIAKANWDNSDKFYFGGYGHILAAESSYTFSSSRLRFATETSLQLSIGPQISYDIFRKDNWKISVGGGINVNWNRNFVKIGSTEENEERLFQGFNFSPRLISNFHWRNFLIPNLDLVFGMDMQLNLAQAYSNSGAPVFADLWSNDDQFESPTGGVFSYLVGIQSNY